MHKIVFSLLGMLIIAFPSFAQNSWIYSSYFGGFSSDTAQAVARDPIKGNVYVGGVTSSAGPPFTSDSPGSTATRVFLATFDSTGAFLSVRLFTGATVLRGLSVDTKGQVYLAMDGAANMTTSSTAYQKVLTGSASRSGFVVKLASDGSTIFATYLGGSNASLAAIAADSDGNALVCGTGQPAFIPITSGAYKSTSKVTLSSFCSKLSSDGSQLLSSTLLGPEDNNAFTVPTAVGADSNGNFVVAGSTPTSAFPTLDGFQTEDRRKSLYRLNPDSDSWITADDGTLASVKTLDFDRQNPKHVFAATTAGVMVSEDGAQTWRLLTNVGLNDTTVLKVHPLNAKYMVHVGTGGNLSLSQDGGATWLRTTGFFVTSNPDLVIADPSSEGTFFILQGGSSCRTDSVVRMNLVNLTFPSVNNLGQCVYYIAASGTTSPTVYLVSNGGLYRSKDGKTAPVTTSTGLSRVWAAPSDADFLYGTQIIISPEAAVVVRSNDGGQTWRELPNAPTPTMLWIDPQSPQTVFIDNAEGLQRSDDGGETWRLADASLSNRSVVSMAKDPSGQIWAGTAEGNNGFLMRLSGDGKTLLSSSLMGGSGGILISALAVNAQGQIEMAGSSASVDFPVTPTLPSTGRPNLGFIVRVSADGKSLEKERQLAAAATVFARDEQGLLHLGGKTSFSGLPVFPLTQQRTNGYGGDGYWMVLDSEWTSVVHSSYLGGIGADSVNGLAVLPGGRVFLAGSTVNSYFPTTANADQGPGGRDDLFITIGSMAQVVSTNSPINLARSGGGRLGTAGTPDSVNAGYATVSLNSGVAPYGTAVFSLKQNGVTVSEAGVAASTPTTLARLFVDFRADVAVGNGKVQINTGVAIANAGRKAATLLFTLKDAAGQTLTTGSATLDAGHHTAKFVDQLRDFATAFALPANFSSSIGFGSLEVSSTQPVSIVALRLTVNQRGETLLTSTPVADIAAGASNLDSLYFPQFTDGGGYTNSIVLMNTTTQVETGTVTFLNDSGTAVAMTLRDGPNSTSFTYSIPAGGVKVMETTGVSAEVRVGSVEVTRSSGSLPSGAGIFRLVQNGIVVTESGVAAAGRQTWLRLYVDTTGTHDTGVALENTDTQPSTVNITAQDSNGVQLGDTAVIQLPGKGHVSAFVSQLIPTWQAGSRGILEIKANTLLAAVTLRSLTNERGDFLLTTFPVAQINQPGPVPIVFPQIADGGGYTTEIILIGTGLIATTATVNFYDNSGAALRVIP